MDKFFAEYLPTLVNTKEVIHSPNSIQDIYGYLLLKAVKSNQTSAARFLLNAGADPNMDQDSGIKMLCHAYEHRNTEMFGLLLSNGASFDACWLVDFLNDTQPGQARPLLEILLRHIDIESKTTGDPLERGILLCMAALCGSTTVVQRILENGSHEDFRPWGTRVFFHDDYENTPLDLAVEKGNVDVVGLMLDYGASPLYGTGRSRFRISNPISPLDRAALNGHTKLVEMLLCRVLALTSPSPMNLAYLIKRNQPAPCYPR